ATAGVLWQPSRAASVGLGYRWAVGVDVNGPFTATPGLLTGPPVATNATGKLVLPDEVTLSARYYLTPPLALLGTIEWQNWSRLQNVAAVGAGCIAGTCETLNLNYRDGWFYSVGVEYAYNPFLLLRMGIAYELSPIRDSNRDILVPDSNRIHLGVGASYKVTARITADVGYLHIFFDDAPFCIGAGGGSSHCTASTSAILLSGKADVSTDILGFGL